MKIFYTIVVLLLVNSFSHSQEIKYVNAKNGLNIREMPSLESQKIGKLNYLQEIVIVENTGVKSSIYEDGKRIEGEWVKFYIVKQRSITGYVFDGYLISKISESNIKEWDTRDFIAKCPKDFEKELEFYIEYERKQWENVPNPIVAKYIGNDFGDYHHIDFEDSAGKIYNFGFGNNNFGGTVLFYEDQHFNDNPKYLGMPFKIFWEWKVSSFPCCSGEYEMVEAYLPSIVKLELVEIIR